MIIDLKVHVANGRVVLDVGGETIIVGRVVICPCCGAKSFGGP